MRISDWSSDVCSSDLDSRERQQYGDIAELKADFGCADFLPLNLRSRIGFSVFHKPGKHNADRLIRWRLDLFILFVQQWHPIWTEASIRFICFPVKCFRFRFPWAPWPVCSDAQGCIT